MSNLLAYTGHIWRNKIVSGRRYILILLIFVNQKRKLIMYNNNIHTMTKKQKWHSITIFELFSFRILFLNQLTLQKVLITELINTNILLNGNMGWRIIFKYSKLNYFLTSMVELIILLLVNLFLENNFAYVYI